MTRFQRLIVCTIILSIIAAITSSWTMVYHVRDIEGTRDDYTLSATFITAIGIVGLLGIGGIITVWEKDGIDRAARRR